MGIKEGQFLKHIMQLMWGILSGRGLSFLNTIFVISIFGQETFGYFAVFISISSIIASFNLLALDKFIPTFDNDTIPHVVTMMIFQIFLTAMIPVVVGEYMGWKYTSYIAIEIVAAGLIAIGNSLNVREKSFRWLSTLQIMPVSSFFIFLSVCFLFKFNTPELLFAGRSISFLAAALFYGYFIILKHTRFTEFSFSKVRLIYWQEKTILLQVSLGNVFNRGVYFFPTLLISSFFGISSTAQYGLMLQFCMIPIGMVNMAVGKVYHGHLASMVRGEGIDHFDRKKTLLILFCITLASGVGMFFVLPLIIGFVMKGDWSDAIHFIRIMTPAFMSIIFVGPQNVAFYIFKKGKIELFGNGVWLILTLISLYIGIYFQNLELGLSLFSGTTCLVMMLFYFLADNEVRKWKESQSTSIV